MTDFWKRRHRRVSVAAIACVVLCVGIAQRTAAQGAAQQYRAADIQAGYKLYMAQCALCHGPNGDNIAGVNLPRGQFHRAVTDNDIKNTIRTGVAAAGMPPFVFQPHEYDILVAYIRSGFDIEATPFRVGDAARGRSIYDGKGACASCHRVHGNGPRAAPDLSDIGMLRKPSAIAGSLLDPSKAMLAINRPVRIVTRDGRTIRGRRLNEDTATVQLIDTQEQLVTIRKADIRDFEIGKTSAMPSVVGKLSDNEVADLLAYLLTLKG